MNASTVSTQAHLPLSTRGASRPRKVAAPPVVDIYGPVHKGLRLVFSRTLETLGTCDTADPGAVVVALYQVRELLDLCAAHLKHENDFVLAAIAARRPGAEAALSGDHVEHVAEIAELRDEVARCEAALSPDGIDAHTLRQLYLQLAFFVGENLVHMNEEETLAQPLLHEIYTAEELVALEIRLVSSIAPEKMAMFLRPMLAAISPKERLVLVAGPRAAMPPEVFDGWLTEMTSWMKPAEIAALRRALTV
jgi:hypothetical protein